MENSLLIGNRGQLDYSDNFPSRITCECCPATIYPVEQNQLLVNNGGKTSWVIFCCEMCKQEIESGNHPLYTYE